jgi:hypothetical protein
MMTVRLGSVPGLDPLQFVGEPSPTIAPRSGEIRVRIEASSLNAHDYSVAANIGMDGAQAVRIRNMGQASATSPRF